MKRNLTVSFLLCIFAVSSAQKYSTNKTRYDSHQYIPQIDDAYNPAVCGLSSFFVPGLGQIISGEVQRGLSFVGGSLACGIISVVGYDMMTNSPSTNNNNAAGKGLCIMLAGFTGMATINIWSIIDAVKVAKTNNMYHNDKKTSNTLDVELSPYCETLRINTQQVVPIGLTMKISF